MLWSCYNISVEAVRIDVHVWPVVYLLVCAYCIEYALRPSHISQLHHMNVDQHSILFVFLFSQAIQGLTFTEVHSSSCSFAINCFKYHNHWFLADCLPLLVSSNWLLILRKALLLNTTISGEGCSPDSDPSKWVSPLFVPHAQLLITPWVQDTQRDKFEEESRVIWSVGCCHELGRSYFRQQCRRCSWGLSN